MGKNGDGVHPGGHTGTIADRLGVPRLAGGGETGARSILEGRCFSWPSASCTAQPGAPDPPPGKAHGRIARRSTIVAGLGCLAQNKHRKAPSQGRAAPVTETFDGRGHLIVRVFLSILPRRATTGRIAAGDRLSPASAGAGRRDGDAAPAAPHRPSGQYPLGRVSSACGKAQRSAAQAAVSQQPDGQSAPTGPERGFSTIFTRQVEVHGSAYSRHRNRHCRELSALPRRNRTVITPHMERA